VLLAGLEAKELNEYLNTVVLKPLTSATVVDRDLLRKQINKAGAQGYAWIEGELDDSICGLAVPVKDAAGKTIAAINVSLPMGQIREDQAVQQYLVDLRQAAAQLRAATM